MGGHLTFEHKENNRTQNINPYGTLNDREVEMGMETPNVKTQRVGNLNEKSKEDTSGLGLSPKSPGSDSKAAPSIPQTNADQDNIFSMQRVQVERESAPKIIQPSEWGAPESSFRTKDMDGLEEKSKVDYQVSQISRSEFTSHNNFEGGDQSVSNARNDNTDNARLASELRLVKQDLERLTVERDSMAIELRDFQQKSRAALNDSMLQDSKIAQLENELNAIRIERNSLLGEASANKNHNIELKAECNGMRGRLQDLEIQCENLKNVNIGLNSM